MSPYPDEVFARQAEDEMLGSPRCAACGCTNNVPCDPPCHWIISPRGSRRLYVHAHQSRLALPDVATVWWHSWALCSTCAPSAVDVAAWPEPRACVAPSWPEWAGNEDCDTAWIRADLVDRAAALLIASDWWCDPIRLVPSAAVACTWIRDPSRGEDFEWTLDEAHDDDAGDDVVLYHRFEVTA